MKVIKGMLSFFLIYPHSGKRGELIYVESWTVCEWGVVSGHRDHTRYYFVSWGFPPQKIEMDDGFVIFSYIAWQRDYKFRNRVDIATRNTQCNMYPKSRVFLFLCDLGNRFNFKSRKLTARLITPSQYKTRWKTEYKTETETRIENKSDLRFRLAL